MIFGHGRTRANEQSAVVLTEGDHPLGRAFIGEDVVDEAGNRPLTKDSSRDQIVRPAGHGRIVDAAFKPPQVMVLHCVEGVRLPIAFEERRMWPEDVADGGECDMEAVRRRRRAELRPQPLDQLVSMDPAPGPGGKVAKKGPWSRLQLGEGERLTVDADRERPETGDAHQRNRGRFDDGNAVGCVARRVIERIEPPRTADLRRRQRRSAAPIAHGFDRNVVAVCSAFMNDERARCRLRPQRQDVGPQTSEAFVGIVEPADGSGRR